jgi:hypothetical protein
MSDAHPVDAFVHVDATALDHGHGSLSVLPRAVETLPIDAGGNSPVDLREQAVATEHDAESASIVEAGLGACGDVPVAVDEPAGKRRR